MRSPDYRTEVREYEVIETAIQAVISKQSSLEFREDFLSDSLVYKMKTCLLGMRDPNHTVPVCIPWQYTVTKQVENTDCGWFDQHTPTFKKWLGYKVEPLIEEIEVELKGEVHGSVVVDCTVLLPEKTEEFGVVLSDLKNPRVYFNKVVLDG